MKLDQKLSQAEEMGEEEGVEGNLEMLEELDEKMEKEEEKDEEEEEEALIIPKEMAQLKIYPPVRVKARKSKTRRNPNTIRKETIQISNYRERKIDIVYLHLCLLFITFL